MPIDDQGGMKTRVTLRDIARKAGVSYATVSLCLAGSAKASAKTRERVRALAKEMGYRRDPVLAALAHYRRGRRAPGWRGTLGVLSGWDPKRPERSRWGKPTFWDGAASRAAKLGYELQGFFLPEDAAGQRRVARVLEARGVAGCLVGALSGRAGALHFGEAEAAGAALVCIGESVTNPLPRVGNDHAGNVLLIARKLVERGAMRIGWMGKRMEAARLGFGPLAGLERARWELAGRMEVVERLELGESDDVARISAWVEAERPDAVISLGAGLPGLEALLGKRSPILAAADYRGVPGWCGVEQDYARIGALAVELLQQQVIHAEEDRADDRVSVVVGGIWREAPQ